MFPTKPFAARRVLRACTIIEAAAEPVNHVVRVVRGVEISQYEPIPTNDGLYSLAAVAGLRPVAEGCVNELTRIVSAMQSGDAKAAEELLPLVYTELRRLATQRLARESPGQTLQPTSLVHEAYLRLVEGDPGPHWNGRGHFFAAAAEAMRRILVENARRKKHIKHGGGRERLKLDDVACSADEHPEELLALDEALKGLEAADALAARTVKLRYFAGLTMPQVAAALDIPLRTAERNWTYARTWLHRALAEPRQ